MPSVVAINISEKRGTIKTPISRAHLTVNFGIEGDAHSGAWHRQVSLLDQRSVDKMIAQGAKGLKPGIFAENITTEGIELCTLPIGTKLRIGDVLLEVTQIGKECHQHCQIYYQVGNCVMPLEGIFARVLQGGELEAGAEITVLPVIKGAVVTLSDKGYEGVREDKSGPALVKRLEGLVDVLETRLLPDDQKQIEAVLSELADAGTLDLIFTTGGTGLAPRDVTPEATRAVCDRLVPGIPEAMRAASAKFTDRAMLSRAVAGTRGKTLIVNLPGSPKAALECLEVLLPVLNHAVETLRGEAFECGRP